MTDREKDAERQLLVQEIEEDLKREQYAKLWERFGGWVIGAAVAVVAVVAGYQGWQSWRTEQRLEEAQAYAAATEAPPAEAASALATLAAEADTDYQTLAALRRASLLAEAGDTAAALAAYDALADDAGIADVYRGLANLRAALLQIEAGDPAAARGRLQILMGGPWRHTAQELEAVLAQRQGDVAAAREIYQRLADDATAPSGLRARAAEMLAVLGPSANQG